MKRIRKGIGVVVTGAALLLAGCGGGGSVAGSATVVTTPTPVFAILAYVNGLQIGGFDVLPGESQTITLSVGQSFALDSDTPVTWTVFVNGVEVPNANHVIAVGEVVITETATTSATFAGYATSPTPLPAPVQVTLVASSLLDGSQSAQINFTITN